MMLMFNVVLYQPEIPPNTGNIMRLCSNSGCYLHLIEPLGFKIDDKSLRRAGMDYRAKVNLQTYSSFDDFLKQHLHLLDRIFFCSSKTSKIYSKVNYKPGDFFVFGPESRGLPKELLASSQNAITIPMQSTERSLNLSNSVAIIIYEALRQIDYAFT